MYKKRGQAALEFLMTYGWAILAAIIVIGVLAYFGVFSPGQFIPSAAVVNPPFYANAWNVDNSDSEVSIELQNNGGVDVSVTSVAITPSDGATDCTTDTTATPIAAGGLATKAITCAGLDAAGETFKADIAITYTKTGSTLALSSTGTITDTIVP